MLVCLGRAVITHDKAVRSGGVAQHLSGFRAIILFALPLNPAGFHIAVRIEEIPLTLDLFPVILRIASIIVLIPPAVVSLFPGSLHRYTACLAGTNALGLLRIDVNRRGYAPLAFVVLVYLVLFLLDVQNGNVRLPSRRKRIKSVGGIQVYDIQQI